MSRPVRFTDHHWPARIFFVPTRKAWGSVMRDLGLDEPYAPKGAAVLRVEREGHEDRVFIALGETCDEHRWDEVVAVMAHECVHVAQYVEDIIGSRLGTEPQAYFVQALLLWLITEYRKAGRGWRGDE